MFQCQQGVSRTPPRAAMRGHSGADMDFSKIVTKAEDMSIRHCLESLYLCKVKEVC